MQYKLDKRSGNQLSQLGFGCMRFPMKAGKIDQQAVTALIQQAIDEGVNYFDTAYAYSGSEESLGNALRELNARDKVFIASKLPHGKVKQTEDLDKLFNTTLERLQTDYVDYYLIHNIINASAWDKLVDLGIEKWAEEKKASGAIKQFGFSFHGSIVEFKKMMDAYDFDFVQIQYNYVNEFYQAGREGLELAVERGIPVVIMEPLLGGRLADSLPPEPLRIFKEAEPNASAASWGLRWLWNQEDVTVVLSGMNTKEQLTDNLNVASSCAPGSLTERELETIAAAKAAFEKNFKVPCAGCNYCMPCPKKINIPAVFTAYNESFALGRITGMFHYLLSAGISSKEMHLATDCSKCGACVKKCPQGINVPVELENARKRVQPPASHLIHKVASKIM